MIDAVVKKVAAEDQTSKQEGSFHENSLSDFWFRFRESHAGCLQKSPRLITTA
jgi:hypothetical protein